MSYGKWSKLYQAYKDDFDYEMTLKEKKLRYSDIDTEEDLDSAIPF